ncbi:MAG TPA: O-antigen ligase family protein [Silvibacterium sp.]|jgi:O-antigen ligase|nr:O-antigen ligase family protein [Silvibacterium sp.]
MKISRKFATELFFFCVLFLSSGAMEAFTVGKGGADPQGSPLMKALWAGIYLVVILRLIPRYRQVRDLVLSNKCFVLLLLLAVYSVRWSADPPVTLAKSIPLLLSAVIGLDFARRFTILEQLRLIWMVLALVLVLGVIAQVFFPGFVPNLDYEPGGAWNGIVTNKNTWARLIVLAGIALLSRPQPTRRSKLVVAILVGMVMALLVASHSAGGLLIMSTMLVLFVGFRALRWPRAHLLLLSLAVAVVCIVGVTYAVQHADKSAAMVGKDANMTGRVPIWRESLRFVRKSPVWGYGYAAFWSPNSRPGRLVREAIQWDNLPHAHNGYIDLALQLGGAGFVLYFAAYLIAMKRAVLLVRRDTAREFLWPLAFLCVTFFYQLDEGSIVTPNQLIWILYSSVIFSVAIEERGYESPVLEEEEELVTDKPALAAGD